MRGEIIVESQEEFDRWISSKKPKYFAVFPEKDPTTPKTDTLKTASVSSIGNQMKTTPAN
jgi:heme/copper-type cytochrome/quinol oxidase subunit 2